MAALGVGVGVRDLFERVGPLDARCVAAPPTEFGGFGEKTAAAATRIRTSPGPGCGSGTCSTTRVSTPPYS
ncbi:hypothetical protein AA958_05435 [Streptomyces sp. CNQ-509]|nr:hypothetical protein AA958_05435 [Streptomyces sp. CNQ-509]